MIAGAYFCMPCRGGYCFACREPSCGHSCLGKGFRRAVLIARRARKDRKSGVKGGTV